jgi:hypothetical protein
MFGELPWWAYAAMAALNVFGFGLGASWMYRWQLWKRRPPQPSATPLPSGPDLDARLIGVVESLQRQLDELAERQDFAERMLAQRALQPPTSEAPRELDTPH